MSSTVPIPALGTDYTAFTYAVLVFYIVLATVAIVAHATSRYIKKVAIGFDDVLTYFAYEEMIEVLYTCFDTNLRSIFMGCPTPENLPKIRQRYVDEMRTDKNDVWIAVRDTSTGKIIAGSNWKVFVNGEPEHHPSEPMLWQDEASRKVSEKVTNFMAKQRKEANPGPFVYLHICFTNEAYRRRGAGGMMMQWGVDLMDALFLPGWLEASLEGNFLYKAFGFYDYESHALGGHVHGMNMRREVRSRGIEGGK